MKPYTILLDEWMRTLDEGNPRLARDFASWLNQRPAPSSWRESEKVQLAEEEYCEAREAFEVTGHEGDMTPQSEVDRLREVRNAKLDALLEAVASAAPSSSATPPVVPPADVRWKLDALMAWQAAEWVHPLTCGTSSRHSRLLPIPGGANGVMLVCMDCDYAQENIPAVCFNGPGENPLAKFAAPSSSATPPTGDDLAEQYRKGWEAGHLAAALQRGAQDAGT